MSYMETKEILQSTAPEDRGDFATRFLGRFPSVMQAPESKSNAIPGTVHAIRYINDFERCDDLRQLRFVMENINRNQYQLISVTQDSENVFTVFFRRCTVG